jgi:hypothetical protein
MFERMQPWFQDYPVLREIAARSNLELQQV